MKLRIRDMAEIIYLKDILLARAGEKTKPSKKSSTINQKLSPLKYDKLLKSSLVEKKKEDIKRN